MATIAIIKQFDTWEGLAPTIELKKFIPEHLMTYEGSFGFGGVESNDPIKAAKTWAEKNNFDSAIHGFYLEVIDTQSPVGTSTHKTQYYPESKEENNFRVTWER